MTEKHYEIERHVYGEQKKITVMIMERMRLCVRRIYALCRGITNGAVFVDNFWMIKPNSGLVVSVWVMEKLFHGPDFISKEKY